MKYATARIDPRLWVDCPHKDCGLRVGFEWNEKKSQTIRCYNCGKKFKARIGINQEYREEKEFIKHNIPIRTSGTTTSTS